MAEAESALAGSAPPSAMRAAVEAFFGSGYTAPSGISAISDPKLKEMHAAAAAAPADPPVVPAADEPMAALSVSRGSTIWTDEEFVVVGGRVS